MILTIKGKEQCMKSVRVQSFSGPYFPVFGLNIERDASLSPYLVQMQENTDHKNSE